MEKNSVNYDSVILSIVIPSYNSAKLLSRCISALENQSAKKTFFEITVADDGSTDETVEMLEKFQVRTELKLQWTTKKFRTGKRKKRRSSNLDRTMDWFS